MKKIKLDITELRIESFDTEVTNPSRGTVFGQGTGTPTYDTGPTCDLSCLGTCTNHGFTCTNCDVTCNCANDSAYGYASCGTTCQDQSACGAGSCYIATAAPCTGWTAEASCAETTWYMCGGTA